MSLVATEAIVLHGFDYRETSRIFRLATRDAGVRSVMARGARNSKARFGPALDLFAEGTAQIILHSTRDLHTLAAFDVTKARHGLAERWPRFVAASALSEIVIRTASEESHHGLYEALASALDALVRADDATAVSAGLAGAWRLVAELGFAPSLEHCAMCGAPLDPAASVRFAHRAGGALCGKCTPQVPGARELPAEARATIIAWIERDAAPLDGEPSARAHMRLFREFLHEHLGDERPLRAFAVWEKGEWLKR